MQPVSEVREEISAFVLESGRCADSSEVLTYLNDARRLLWPRGDWKGTVAPLLLQQHSGVITLPYDYEVIRQGFQSNEKVESAWWWPIPHNRVTRPLGKPCYEGMIDLGDKFASFKDYRVSNRSANHRLKVFTEDSLDKGIELVFQSIGENGNRVHSTIALGEAWERVQTNDWIQYFRSVVKPKTIGRVIVSIWDANRNVEQTCAIYEPDDLNPNYRRYRVSGIGNCPVEVKAKRKYRKLVNETDLVEFPIDALIHACNALTKRRQRQMDEYVKAVNLAAEVLQVELAESEPRTVTRLKKHPYPVTNL